MKKVYLVSSDCDDYRHDHDECRHDDRKVRRGRAGVGRIHRDNRTRRRDKHPEYHHTLAVSKAVLRYTHHSMHHDP